CNPGGGAPLEPLGGADAPVVESVAPERGGPAGGSPAGGEVVVIRGKSFPPEDACAVRFGRRSSPDVKVVSPTEIRAKVPDKLPAGETLSVSVERSTDDDDGNTKVSARGVLPGAWPVGGLSSTFVVLIGCAIGAYALLGGPLFVVLASV